MTSVEVIKILSDFRILWIIENFHARVPCVPECFYIEAVVDKEIIYDHVKCIIAAVINGMVFFRDQLAGYRA